MKRVIVFFLSLLIVLSMVSCGGETVYINASNSEELVSSVLTDFVRISDKLSYDAATRIVYIRNVTYAGPIVHTPYFAPNGLPYRYNASTNTLEEIVWGIKYEKIFSYRISVV